MVESVLDAAMVFVQEHAFQLVYAIVVLIIGFWLASIVAKITVRSLEKRNVDASLKHFLRSFIKVSLRIMVIITVASMVGIATTSFIAVLGAAGLAIGFALQGSLANFAGGVLILLLKPFKVGEFISASGTDGTVEKIDIFYTTIKTTDNVTIIIPNAQLSNNSVTNFSRKKTRRINIVFGVSYTDDIKKVQEILLDILHADERILKDPEPFARVSELADSSVNFNVRAWTSSDDFWAVRFDLIETVKLRFDKEGISIPFPQMDVYVKK